MIAARRILSAVSFSSPIIVEWARRCVGRAPSTRTSAGKGLLMEGKSLDGRLEDWNVKVIEHARPSTRHPHVGHLFMRYAFIFSES